MYHTLTLGTIQVHKFAEANCGSTSWQKDRLEAVQVGNASHDLMKDFGHPIFSKSALVLTP